MIIKVDIREQEMFKLIKYYLEISPSYKNITIVSENLPLGDVIICDENNVERLIIERKSIRDLSSSIKDGRYEEQSYRLNGSPFSNHNIIYLIEGDLNSKFLFKDRIDKISLYSAMFSLNHYKGFSVLRTFTIDETSLVICNMAYKMKKCDVENKKPYYKNKVEMLTETPVLKPVISATEPENTDAVSPETPVITEQNVDVVDNNDTEANEKDYCSVIKKVKKENVTPQNIGEIMLCQIPGISSVSAIAILKEFQTLPNLLNKLRENKECLNDVSYVNSKNQTRKINKTVIQNIKKFLLC
uniref:ERCC4 domain-containing protein n=1 Tax=viral metagenome TaxID=1070528 RepID=A0A6C0DIL6_9ZZZZ